MRTVILGCCGLERRHLERFADAAPTLTALGARGVEATLETDGPSCPTSAWPTLYTGTDPSHHGIFGPNDLGAGYPDEPTPVSGVHVRRPALWEYLSSEGARSVVMNVPLTHPADPIDGVVVPGPPAPADERGYPDGVREAVGFVSGDEYTIHPQGETLEAHRELLERRRRAFASALDVYEWELAVCHLSALAPLLSTGDDEQVRAAVEATDRTLESILETVDEETNVVCCSTHGVERTTREIGLNDLLAGANYLETRGGSAHTPSTPLADGLERLRTLGRRVLGRTEPSRATRRIDWPNSLAYCPETDYEGIRVNLAGRDPNGQVPPSRYRAVCDDLVETLAALETPTGDPAFESVRLRERRYGGPFLENAPDVFVRPTAGYRLSAALGTRPIRAAGGYRRTPRGLFLGSGPDFDTGSEGERRLSLASVAPLTMGLLGRPVPSLMTGDPAAQVLERTPERAEYVGVAAGAATVDPTFDDADITAHRREVGSSEF
ncbi:alkaline phosphatase family protein [Natronobiforma cellulositropha]|uniref:alkaline phosphatase family protein n=1 Tax=Natronobiforma cellulositropha TaxID=1679076 RepID=UPI0021D5B22B|nr:alkaline phosphatase family protein [Natronobiforma cellulositropha]